MICGRQDAGKAWCAVLLLAIAARAGEPAAQPLTIMPFQTATFVSDAASAAEINGFAEFSSRLLYWTDMPREPVVLAGQVLKTSLMPFIDEWRGVRPVGSVAASGIVRTRVTEAYRALHGPRLARITVEADTTVIPPAAVDVLTGEAGEIPCVIENRRATPVRIEIGAAGACAPRYAATLSAGQSVGVFLAQPVELAAGSVSWIVAVDGQARPFDFTVRRHERGSLAVEVRDETGAPTPARVYLTGSDRRAYAPAGVMHRLVSGECGQPFAGDAYFHTAGKFEVSLPCGETTVEIVKGLEYQPQRLSVWVEAGKPVTSV